MKKTDVTRFVGVSLLFSLLALPGGAAPSQPIAEVENLGDTLVFHPHVQFAQLILTVSGPCGFDYRQVVTEGEPFFRLDQTTIDGPYTYNLFREETVDPDIVEILQQARKNFDDETAKQLCRDGKLPAPPLVQAEGFTVFRGEIQDMTLVEKVARVREPLTADDLGTLKPDSKIPVAASSRLPTKDFVILDDLIVDGSACIGFDCVNGESFGFDTIRLKENNLRIKFDDTSTAASFPRNDWQITANDSANGGASKLSFDDISGSRTPFTVEANARSHSLYVDDGGRIGSRTSTPSTEIHTIDGDTPTLRLQQDGSSGFAPQTWDVAGNETNFFIRDVSNGSQLPFRIRPNAPTSSIFIDVTGDVGIGTASPDSDLDIEDSNPQLKFNNTDTPTASTNDWLLSVVNAGFRITRDSSGGPEVEIDNDGNVTLRGNLTACDDATICSPTDTFPDYVFEPDYPLMPLDKLAAFIEDNKHLPNVPTVEDVSKSGINMTQLQMKLLEKVEELTLYTLSQQETIQSQSEMILELRQRLQTIEGQ